MRREQQPPNSRWHDAALFWKEQAALRVDIEQGYARMVAAGVSSMEPERQQAEQARKAAGDYARIYGVLALAWKEMQDAGGPDNSRAYVEYEATVKQQTALLPRFFGELELES